MHHDAAQLRSLIEMASIVLLPENSNDQSICFSIGKFTEMSELNQFAPVTYGLILSNSRMVVHMCCMFMAKRHAAVNARHPAVLRSVEKLST